MTDSVLKDTVNALADKLVVTDLRQPGKVKFPLVPSLFAIITAWCSGCNNAVAVADYLCSKRKILAEVIEGLPANLTISTLRYYDKEGLFPTIQRDSGIRKFGEKELEALRVIECLKKSGLEIRDIKQFMAWCVQGSETYPQRRELFLHQKAAVEAEIERMNRVLDMLRFKCWYYEQAIRDGNEDRLSRLRPEDMPEEIRRAYEHAHSMDA